jgi:hypothetical protein
MVCYKLYSNKRWWILYPHFRIHKHEFHLGQWGGFIPTWVLCVKLVWGFTLTWFISRWILLGSYNQPKSMPFWDGGFSWTWIPTLGLSMGPLVVLTRGFMWTRSYLTTIMPTWVTIVWYWTLLNLRVSFGSLRKIPIKMNPFSWSFENIQVGLSLLLTFM